ncbi:putative glucan endo-1,3-beta-glucosidase [Paramyrothecium foliicola]|nr:putative glucan endo-1,3-beta-glucosidase [Paramyrothecium foliicola]
MRFTSSILPAVVALATGASAWAQGGDGVWRANNNFYELDGYGAEMEALPPLLEITDEIADGKRRGEKCSGSTTKIAIVYLTPGQCRVSSTIPVPLNTQVIGDPTLVASRNFIGLSVLSANEYTGGGTGIDGRDQWWYVNMANFYLQIRNLKIDSTQTRPMQAYNFNKARNIFAGMIQSKLPNHQLTPNPLVGRLPGDSNYSKCGSNGLYSWFSTYTRDCICDHACQKALMLLEDNHAGVRFQHIITIGANHPRWSQISVLDVASNGEAVQLPWIDHKI